MRSLLPCSLCCLMYATAACGEDSLPARPERVLTTNGGPVAFSPDGKKVFAGNADGVVTVWDVESRKPDRSLTRPAGVIRAVAWSPDGRLLAAAGVDRTVTVWDAGAGREAYSLKGHTEIIQSINFSADSKLLVSGASDKTVRLWDVRTGKGIRVLLQPEIMEGAKPVRGIPSMVFSVAFSPDGKLVASGGGDGAGQAGELVLWEAETGKQLRRLLGRDEQQVWALAFSPDGKLLAAGATGGAIRLFDVQTGAVRREFRGGDQLRGLAISANGRTLAAAIRSEVKLWDMGSGELVRALREDGQWILSIAFAADGSALVSGGSEESDCGLSQRTNDFPGRKTKRILMNSDVASSWRCLSQLIQRGWSRHPRISSSERPSCRNESTCCKRTTSLVVYSRWPASVRNVGLSRAISS